MAEEKKAPAAPPPPMPPLPVFDYPVSPRENMQLVIDHKEPYWVPNMSTDIQMTFCPQDNERPYPLTESGSDWFGLYWEFIPLVGGQMVRPESHILDDPAEWEQKLIFPDLDKIDFSIGAEEEYKRLQENKDKPVFYVMQNGIWERLLDLAPTEKVFIFLLENPESARKYFDTMADFKIKIIQKLINEWVPIDCIISSDDWGTQYSMFFSAQTFEDLIFPGTKKIVDFVHANGMWVDTHSCGKCEPLVPYMIEMETDMWEPQHMNDLKRVKQEYGDKLNLRVMPDHAIMGAPDMTRESSIAYLREFIETLGAGGGLLSGVRPTADRELYIDLVTEFYNFSRQLYGK